jgi:acetyl esterase/lipase
MRRTWIAILLAMVCSVPAYAVSRRWTGQVSSNWSVATNWSPAGVPTAADDLEFPGTNTPRTVTFDLPPGTSVGKMAFLGEYIIGGNAMTLTGDLSFLSSPSAVAVDFDNDLKLGNTIRVWGPYRVTFNGAFDINGQTVTMGTTYNTIFNGPVLGTGTFIVEPRGVSLLGSGGNFSGTLKGNAFVTGAYPAAAFNSPWLTGTGTIGATTVQHLSPGEWQPGLYHDPHELGTMHTGPLSITSQYSVDLVPGGSYDQVRVTGTVSVAGTLAVTIPSGTAPLPGSTYTIIDNDGTDPVSGAFTGKPEGSTFTVGSTPFVITYAGGDGNDVVLNVGQTVKTWTGYTSDKWSVASNWSPPVVPVPGEPLVFPPCCSARLQTTNDLPSFNPGLMTFNGEYTLSGNELTLTDNLNFAFGNSNYVYFTCNAPLKLADSVTFNPSTQQIYNGAIDVNGHTLTIDTYDTKIYNTLGTIINGPINGTGTIVVPGRGLSIRSSGTFTGSINGIVDVIGSYPGATVTGTRVSGNGTLGAVTTGTLAAGTWDPVSPASRAIGTLQTGPLSVSSKVFVELDPGKASDQIVVTGTVAIGGVLEVKFTWGAGTPTGNETFTIIDNDGTDPVNGTFTGLSEGATIVVGTSTFRISYRGGDGNDVVLAHVPAAPTIKTWKSYVDGRWGNWNNWTGMTIPAAGEPILFPPDAKVISMTNDLPAGFTVGTMTFQNNYVLNGNLLTLNGDLEFATGVAFQATTPLKIGAAVRFHAATTSSYDGAIDVNGQTLTVDSNSTTVRGAINGSGTIDVTGVGVSVASSGTFAGAINGNADIVGSYAGATVTSTRLSGAGALGAVTAGSLSPGSSNPCCADAHTIGTLQTGPLSIATQLAIDLVPGGTSDQVRVTGPVSVGGSLQVTMTGTASPGQSFTLIDNDGSDAVSGTFTGLAEGATLTVGASTFTISYRGGDGNDVVLSTAGTGGNTRATTTTLTQNRVTTEEHQPVTFTATVSATSGVPTGSVTFFAGSENLGTAPLANGVAALTVKTLAIGTHDISATYPGSEGFDASSSPVIVHRVVRGNPHLTIASSASAIVYGDPVSFSLAVQSAGTRIPTGTVTVEIDGSAAGSSPLAANGTATITLPMLPAGQHTVTATYSGDGAFSPATASITQTVTKAPTSVALESLANPSPVGLPVTVAIQVSPVDHPAMAVGGNVVVENGGRTVTEAQLIASAASVRVGPLAGGNYSITVTYAGNNDFQPATATLTQHVSEPAVVIEPPAMAERHSAYHELVRVELTEASARPVTVDYRTVDGTATANFDYIESRGTIVFNPGQTSATIPILILGDAAIEPDETFTIELTNASGAALAADRVTFVIENDDLSYRAPVAHTIATDAAAVQATVYAPAATDGPWPVILWIPGDTAYDGAGGGLAALRQTAQGYAVVSVAYRPAATAPFPAQVVDLMAAVRWLRANAATLNIDPTRIAAWGTGAGAHLATLLGTGIDGADAASRVEAVVAWGGISDLSSLQADAFRCSTTAWSSASSPASQLIGCALSQCPASADAASPARYANAGDAPMLLMHGSADCFVAPRQSERLYEALKRAGVDATLRIIDFAGHDDPYWTSAAAFAEVDAFLDAKLKGASTRRRSARH